MAKDKDKKEKKGLLGRIFGGKKEDEGKAATPVTPGATPKPQGGEGAFPPTFVEGPAFPPTFVENPAPKTPGAKPDFSPVGETYASDPPGMEPVDSPTIPPGYHMKNAKAGAAQDPADAMTMPPGYHAKAAKAGAPLDDPADAMTMPPGYIVAPGTRGKSGAPPRDDAGELTMAPSYAKPGARGGSTPPPPRDDAGELTMAPSYAKPGSKPAPRAPTTPAQGDAGELTMAPAYARDKGAKPATPPQEAGPFSPGGDDPFGAMTIPPQYAKPRPAAGADPFALADDLMGGPPGAPAAPLASGKSDDTFTFGDDPLAPAPARPEDPFGAALADDPFAGGPTPAGAERMAPPPPAQRPGGHKTQELAASDVVPSPPAEKPDRIDVFDLELGEEPVPAPGRAAAPAVPRAEAGGPDPGFQAEKTLAMDAPLEQSSPFRAKSTLRHARPDAAIEENEADEIEEPRAAPPPPAPRRPLFASSTQTRDGSSRLATPAPELVIDHATGVFFAPPVPGGWSAVPACGTTLSCGSVVGRLPSSARREPDGSIVIPRPQAARAYGPEPAGPGRRASPFPQGVVVDREAGVAYARPEAAELVAGSPEPSIRTEDGGLLLLLPRNVRWKDDGSYVVPPEPPKSLTGKMQARSDSPPPAPAHDAHGAAVSRATYLGCEEIGYEDGWAKVSLPRGAKVGTDEVLLPPSCAFEPGARPDTLEVETRTDGWLALHLPDSCALEPDLVWIGPPFVAEPEADSGSLLDEAFLASLGEPTSVQLYLGIEDSLYANGWSRLDLPPGATVTERKLKLPREYAHAGPTSVAASFERELDGALTTVLPANAEILGNVVLIPPPGTAPRRYKPPETDAPSEPEAAESEPGDEGTKRKKKRKKP